MTHHSGLKFKGSTKILKLRPEVAKDFFDTEGAFLGFAGSTQDWGELVQWYTLYDGSRFPKVRDIELALLTNTGDIYYSINARNWTQIRDKCFAIGTGMVQALGAMEAGATPLEAVKIASKYDPNTGMGFKEYKF